MALSCFNNVLALAPTDGAALLNRGISHLIARDYANAERDFDAALIHHPHAYVVQMYRAKLFTLLQRYAEAESAYLTAAELHPASAGPSHMLLESVRRKKVEKDTPAAQLDDSTRVGLMKAELREYARTLNVVQ